MIFNLLIIVKKIFIYIFIWADKLSQSANSCAQRRGHDHTALDYLEW